MANVKLVFYGTESNETELVCYANMNNEIFIEIDMGGFAPSFITLNKSTAIKLAKTLRTEINKIEDHAE